jgi:hypothetical protein
MKRGFRGHGGLGGKEARKGIRGRAGHHSCKTGEQHTRGTLAKEGDLQKEGGMPELPDGTLSDEDGIPGPNVNMPRSGYLGKEGRPTHYTGARSEHVPAWRYPLRAQISAVSDEVISMDQDLIEWEAKAREERITGYKSGADWVCEDIRTRRDRKAALLKWLREQIPIDPATGRDLDEF